MTNFKNGNSKVKKAVIPAAGLGTRFFPVTKTIPKEMLPIVDKPIILYVIEEAIQAGIEDIVLIQGRGKTAIEDFFDISYELEDKFNKEGKSHLLENLNEIRKSANIISLRQKSALGLGHAVHCAKPVVGDEPFAVLLGDEITISEDPKNNVTHFLCEQYQSTNQSSVWVLPVNKQDVSKYGIIDLGSKRYDNLDRGGQVLGVVEKPTVDTAPSQWALPGRYVFDSKILSILAETKPGKNGEIQLSDAMNVLAQNGGLNGYSFAARRFDAGDKLGFLIANIELALQRDELKDDLTTYLKQKFKG
jgi:UTP--glucose-1-phosphate uridylyltransferase